jgi:molecular chaperone DnaK (HSP70)
VGGGARVPCVQECIKQASCQTQTRHTLDSSAAVAFGAASLGKLLQIENIAGTPPQSDANSEDETQNQNNNNNKSAAVIIAMDKAFLEVSDEGRMSDQELSDAVQREAQMRETDRLQRAAHDARNALEEWVYGMREAVGGRSGHLLDRSAVEGTCIVCGLCVCVCVCV